MVSMHVLRLNDSRLLMAGAGVSGHHICNGRRRAACGGLHTAVHPRMTWRRPEAAQTVVASEQPPESPTAESCRNLLQTVAQHLV